MIFTVLGWSLLIGISAFCWAGAAYYIWRAGERALAVAVMLLPVALGLLFVGGQLP